jgi:hypothetical protein
MMPLALFLFLATGPALAGPSFVSGLEGEVVSDVELDLSLLPAFSWVSDPFLKVPGGGRRSPASVSVEEGDYKLQATTIEGEEAVAVVNDSVVRVGDRVGRRTVLKIGPSFVLLGENGSVIEATLEESKAGREPASIPSAPEGRIKIEEVKK